MKKTSLFWTIIFVLASCKKETSQVSMSNITGMAPLSAKVMLLHQDTVTEHKSFMQLSVNEGSLTCVYDGNNYYSLTEAAGSHNFTGGGYYYKLFKDGVAIENALLPAYTKFTISRQLSAGQYYFLIYATGQSTDSFQTNTITIVDEPTAPAGMVCLFRYFNNTSGQHICTSSWDELGSNSVGFQFEKVLGYMYSSSSAAFNLKPIYRYYKSSDGSHFTTDIQGTYSGFVFEKILGYAGISQTATLNRALTKYYLNSTDDHFVCVPPDVPTYPGFTKDVDFIFGYVQ